MSGAARSASICRSTCNWPTISSRRPSSSPRTWRRATGCRPSWRRSWRKQLPSVVARVSPLELGPPVGWPVQYRVSGPDIDEVRAIALRLGQAMGADRQRAAGQFRLDGAGAEGAHPDRPGSGAASGPELAGAGRRSQYGDDGNADHAGSRRHLSRQRRRPRDMTNSASRCRRCAPCSCRCPTAAPCR